MKLRIVREHYTPDTTVGRLFIDGVFECFTLEDGIRTNKVDGETAIPAGTYPVRVTHSPRFRRRLPLLDDVPKFSGVRIHPGNTRKDTLGCILVGRSWQPGSDFIGGSRLAFDALLPKIEAALTAGERVVVKVEQPNAPRELAIRAVRRKRMPPAPKKKASARRARRTTTARTSPRNKAAASRP